MRIFVRSSTFYNLESALKVATRQYNKFLPSELEHFVIYWFHHFSVMLVYINSCINPFIYVAKYGEFQNGIRRMIDRLSGVTPQIQPQQQHQNIRGTQETPNPIRSQPQDTAVT